MTSIVFPGQGSQFVNMSKDFYDNFRAAKDVFELIADVTKINIKKIIFENPSNLINQTQYTQLAIFCSSISIFNVLKLEKDIKNLNIACMLGHSLGEYTALTAAGFLSIEDCSFLLKTRGELMQNAYKPNESGMAAIIGINCEKAENIIAANKLNLQVANDNSPFQIVVSGKNEDLLNSELFFKKSGIKKFIQLNVSAAFHSKLMKGAEKKMNEFISKVNFNNSSISIISNYNPNISNNPEILIKNLSHQMSNKVRWVESIQFLEKINETRVIEIGPGRVLSGLIKRISSNFNVKNIEYISDIEKI